MSWQAWRLMLVMTLSVSTVKIALGTTLYSCSARSRASKNSLSACLRGVMSSIVART